MKLIHTGEYAKQLYDNHAGTGDRSDVARAVMAAINALLKPAEHVPAGKDVTAEFIDQKADTEAAIKAIRRVQDRQAAGSVSVTLVGETHRNRQDEDRANTMLAAMTGGTVKPTLLLLERGLGYAQPAINAPIVSEANLTNYQGIDFGIGLDASQRSMVVAGYLVCCLASGDQRDIDKVVLLFGENHFDILDRYFDYYAAHTNASHVLRRNRTFLTIRSHAK